MCAFLIYRQWSTPTQEVVSYVDATVRNCAVRLPEIAGKTFEVLVPGGAISFVTWTKNESFDRDTVSVRKHEAVRLMESLSRSATLLDVGADVGLVTMPILALPHAHTVMAIEARLQNVNHLCLTANLNGWVGAGGIMLLHAAVWDGVWKGFWFWKSLPERLGSMRSSWGYEKMRWVMGDDVLFESGLRPDVIRIGAQGWEIYAISGLKTFMKKAGFGKLIVMKDMKMQLMKVWKRQESEVYELMIGELRYSAYCRPEVEEVRGVFVVKGRPISQREYLEARCELVIFHKTKENYL